MMQTFTQNDLVRHLYTEESTLESDQISSFLALDEQLTESFNDYCLIKKALSLSLLDPSSDSVNYILEYSKLTALD